jgi:hypothetical protein
LFAHDWDHLVDEGELFEGDLLALNELWDLGEVWESERARDVLTSVLLELGLDSCLNRQGGNIVIVLHDEAHCIRLGGNCADELVVAVEVAIHYVFLDCLVEEKWLLLHD